MKKLTAEELCDKMYNNLLSENLVDGAIWEYKSDICKLMEEYKNQ